MTTTIDSVISELTQVFTATDEVLSDWKSESNLQIPVLVGMLAVKLNWDEKKMREADPLIRYYVRKLPDWSVTRGAHGGMSRVADKLKKDQAKVAKNAMKEQLQAQINAKVAQSSSTPINIVTTPSVVKTASVAALLDDEDIDE